MQTNTTIVLLSSVLVLSLAGLGWQAWSGHEMREDLRQLQQQLAALPGAGAAANQLGAPAPLQPPAGTPGAPVPLDPFRNADPLDPGLGAQDPFAAVERMQQEMQDRMRALMGGTGGSFFDFDDFGPNGFSFMGGSLGQQPQIAIEESPEAYEVTIALPEGSNVEVSTAVEGRELTIEGKVSVEVGADAGNGGYAGTRTQQFARTLTLPADVDVDGIRNETRDGQVVITLPKIG